MGCYFTTFAQVSIIGGSVIDISEAPYQVSIELENGVHDCGGMILSERWILTAAHCVFNSGLVITSPLLENLVVHAGSTNQTLDNVGQRINVESIVVNPNYDPPSTLTTIEHDIALLYLESPLEFNTNVQPRRYADFCNTQLVDIASGEMASIAGWGRTAFSPPPIDNLNFAEIPIVSTAEANTIYDQVVPGSGLAVTANNIAFYDSEVQQGSGDSGGAFFIEKDGNSLAVGVASWSLTQSDGTIVPSIGTNVRVYSDWIESESGISSSTSGLDLFMKDRPWDLGKEPSNVDMGWVSDDIWIRNQADGVENQIHENPEFSLADPVYVYVRVRNRGCIASTGTEQLTLSWAKASTSLTWPDYWDGSTTFGTNGPLAGDEIDVRVINEVIEPGGSAILEFEWDNMPNPSDYDLIGNDEPWHFCLLLG
ncbi:MAG: serine protease [Cryomorphaceae bacterium]